MKQESQDEALVPLCAKSHNGFFSSGFMQKVPSLSDLSDPESSLGKSRSSPDVTWRHRSALGFHFSVVSSFSCVCVCMCVSPLGRPLDAQSFCCCCCIFFFFFIIVVIIIFYYCYLETALMRKSFNCARPIDGTFWSAIGRGPVSPGASGRR